MIDRKTLLFYALPALPLAALLMPIYIFLPTYYAETLGLGLAAVGLVRIISGLWDVITDPIIGVLSDNTKHPCGRRKIWILSGLPFTLIGSWCLLVPPFDPSLLTMTLFSAIMILGWTMMLLPLNALAGELCQNYIERTRINTWRESFGLLGVLIPLGLIAGLGFTGNGEQGDALRVIATMVAITLPLFTACLMWFVKEPTNHAPPKSFSISESFQILKQNSYFKILIRSYFLNAVANGLPASLILIYVSDLLNAPDKVAQFLFIYFLAGVISTPFWNYLGTKFSKHKIWCVAMGFACFVFAAISFLNEGDVTAYLIICILTGIVFGADLIYPPSMQADVIDSDTAISGQSRAGLFFALWGIATKLSLALATGFGFLLLDYFQKSDFIIIILYAIIPIAFKIISMAGMWNFGLTKEKLNEIQIQQRNV